MRASPAAAILVMFLAVARSTAASDDILYAVEVKDADAEVRSGPGSNDPIYATNRLTRGTIVQVLEELPEGWLKIKPPHGSFSFINTRFVDHIASNNWVVASAADVRVPVFVGSDLKPNDRGAQQGVTLPRGTQVIAVSGQNLIHEDDSWLRIEPPRGEYRYIRATAVRKVEGATQALVAKTAVNQPGAERVSSVSPPAPSVDMNSATALIVEAIKADNEKRYVDAVALYRRYLNTAQYVVPLDQQRINDVRQRLANLEPFLASAPAARPPAPTPTATGDTRLVAEATRPPVPADTYPSSGPGVLYRSGRKIDDLPAYRLESSLGYPILYVTPQAGVNLELFVGHKVELAGPAVYRGELRGNYMTVVRVRDVP